VDWAEIAGLYAVLLTRHPSPVVALNHAAAVGMAFGPERGLALLSALEETGQLAEYHLMPAAKADLLRRLGRTAEAAAAYREALARVTSPVERRYLQRRLGEASR
jgi:RNA polymerase sigma-70 factor (ECF subfamily)